MKNAMLVDSGDLKRWAGTRSAQADLPRLLRRLVLASCPDATSVSFRAGDSVATSGWDGLVEAGQGTAFVPGGHSVWEVGVQVAAGAKAEEDYLKRTSDPLGVDPSTETYVAVIPRPWKSKDKWVTNKRSEGHWRDVKAYHADDLETWLESVPSVHIWFSIHLGKQPIDAVDIESFWEDYARQTCPPISSALVVGSRLEARNALLCWLAGTDKTIALQAETREESAAFVAGILAARGDEDGERWRARCIVVKTPGALRELAASEHPLILVPMFDDASAVTRATSNGHRVLLPLDHADNAPRGQCIALQRSHRADLEAALIGMNFTKDEARDLSVLARRSLTAFRRRTAESAALFSPLWSKPEHGRSLVPALLAGQWNEASEADHSAIEALAGYPYDSVKDRMVRWANEADAPVRQIGTIWTLTSREDAWPLLARYVTSEDLNRLLEICLRVLGELDPSLDLPPEKRFAAGLYHKERKHSGTLRTGLAETLAAITALPAPVSAPDGGGWQDWSDRVVRDVLDISPDAGLWVGNWPLLPLLAEASPTQFLNAVERLCAKEDPVARALFEDQDNVLLSSSAHTGLLWGLEVLAWSPMYLSHAARLIARLAEIDPGGKHGNRPLDSLHNILSTWCPNTSAPAEGKLAALDLLRRQAPDVAWQLLVYLIPRSHEIGSFTCKPRWRDWVSEDEPEIPRAELVTSVGEIVSRVLEDVGVSGKRWKAILDTLVALPPSDRGRIIGRLGEIGRDKFSRTDLLDVWNALRRILSRHSGAPNRPWTLPKDITDRVAVIYDRLTPSGDPTSLYAWLFCPQPDIVPPIENWDERQLEVSRRQEEGAAKAYADGGVEALVRLADVVDSPSQVGAALGRSLSVVGTNEAPVLELVGEEDQSHQAMAAGFIQGRMFSAGIDWLNSQMSGPWFQTVPPRTKAAFLRCLGLDDRTLDFLESAGEETRELFWKSVPAWPGVTWNHSGVIDALVSHGRIGSAINYIQAAGIHGKLPVPISSVAEVMGLAGISGLGEDYDRTMFSYSVGELLDVLAASDEVDKAVVGRLEWLFLPLFRFDRRPPKVLHEALASDPDFFNELLEILYHGRHSERRNLSSEQQYVAQTAHDVLGSWQTIPGAAIDGTVNGSFLLEWIEQVRQRATLSDRLAVADHHIGMLFAYSPMGSDGGWPAEPIRDIVEALDGSDIADGLYCGVYNKRGVVSRGLTEGGSQERSLAAKYHQFATSCRARWPRTALVLDQIAAGYEREAKQEDMAADAEEDGRF
jgi:hypothetical protein